MFVFFRGILAFCCAAFCLSGATHADEKAFDFGWDVLEIRSFQGKETRLSLDDLDALRQISFTTTTIWTEGEVTFSGPPLRDVLKAGGVMNGHIEMMAYNHYLVDTSLESELIGEDYPIVATRMNGEVFDIADRGPFWLVWPYDSDQRFKEELVYALSIWQLSQIDATR